MSAPGIDFGGLQSACLAAVQALESGDYQTARLKAVQAQLVIVGIGSSATAGGANLQLALDTINSVIENVSKLEAYTASITTNGRTIRTGLFNGGRRGGPSGGVIYE